MSVKPSTRRVRDAVAHYVTQGAATGGVPVTMAGMVRNADGSGTISAVVAFAGVETIQTLDGDAIAETGMCVVSVVRDGAMCTGGEWHDVYAVVGSITGSVSLGATAEISDAYAGAEPGSGSQTTSVRITSVPRVGGGYTSNPRGNGAADLVIPVSVDYWASTSKG